MNMCAQSNCKKWSFVGVRSGDKSTCTIHGANAQKMKLSRDRDCGGGVCKSAAGHCGLR
jgi:hypothetical protein